MKNKYTIAIVTPYFNSALYWMRTKGDKQNRYIIVDHNNKARGLIVDEVMDMDQRTDFEFSQKVFCRADIHQLIRLKQKSND